MQLVVFGLVAMVVFLFGRVLTLEKRVSRLGRREGMNPFTQFVKEATDRIGKGFSSLGQNDPAKIAYMRNLERQLQSKDMMEMPFDELRIVVFDLETTGFYPYKGDEILSIGAVRVQGKHVLEDETFYSLVYSDVPPSEQIEELTGITGSMLEEAPPIREVLKDFYSFVRGGVLIAHHARHEKQFMAHATWRELKKTFSYRIVDTAFVTRIAQEEKQLTTLDDCCSEYGISIDERHHALSDAIATAKLWAACIEDIQKLGFVNLRDVYTYLAEKGEGGF
ncbi:exonuclease domain-containing protein [Salimicrobium flavidum]|uniref:DNA polymerase-3 subunit epsilon n=1 Tax=Salimicrobium flavidum TaxID=570947 RepID=A0A1N7J9B3_9BACI|nr:exonuclease domain-containing protein [Salimicrobium flavidum]SIS45904.1 DNA polymerase-3 subunit epsilon [Salimicrobium flavidum]